MIRSVQPTFIAKYNLDQYIEALFEQDIPKENIAPFCKIVKRLSASRTLIHKLETAIDELYTVDGTETLQNIIAKAEQPIVEVTNSLIGNTDTINLPEYLPQFVEYLTLPRPSSRGVSSGFPRWDRAIGGGFRKPGVTVVGARAKQGKSFFAVEVANNIIGEGTPVLYLDSELTKDITMVRLLAMRTGIKIDDLESGEFAKNPATRKTVEGEVAKLKDAEFSYHNIAGLDHKEWISVIRRWIMRKVGFHPDGTTKDCLVILDYLKTMNLGNIGKQFQEYQHLGQVITDLHNLCVAYNIPMLALVQLNRDGIARSDQGVIAGSDRIMALCTSFSILRKKEAEDFADDPRINGDRKFEVIDCRFGPSLDDGEYINLITDLSKGKILEGKTNIENRASKNMGMVKLDGNTQIQL